MRNYKQAEIHDGSLIRDTSTTTLWSVLGKGIGFLIPFFIAAWFGATAETDIFFFAYGIILFIAGILIPLAESIIVPYIAEARSDGRDVGKFIGGILETGTIGIIILTGLLILFIKPLLYLITDFDEKSLRLAYLLLAETSPLIIFSAWSSVFAAGLNAYRKFKLPALSPAFRALVNLAVIFIFKNRLGVHAIAIGYVAGEIVRLLILCFAVYRFRLFTIAFSIRTDPKLKEFFRIASYQAIALVALGLNPVVDRAMASWLSTGNISVLYYADRLYFIPVTIGVSGLSVVLLSGWSKLYYTHRKAELLRSDFSKIAKRLIPAAVFATVFLCLLSGIIVLLVYGRSKLSWEALLGVRQTFVFYALGLTPYFLGMLTIRFYQVLKDTRILMKWAIFSVAANVLCNLILMRYMGVAGLALSTTIVCAIGSLYLYLKLPVEKKDKGELPNANK